MTREQIDQVCRKYSSNNDAELKRIISKKLFSYGITSEQDKDYDDYLGLAHEVLFSAATSFDESKNDSFEGYLVSCLFNKFSTMQRDQKRDKRCQTEEVYDEKTGKVLRKKIQERSLNQKINDSDAEGMEFGDTLKSDYDLENEVFHNENHNLDKYLSRLSKKQQVIASMLMEGYKPAEIKEKLGLDDVQYSDQIKFLKCDENISILTNVNSTKNVGFNVSEKVGKKEEKRMQPVTSMEKNKIVAYQARDLIKKLRQGAIQANHPLQREADQHTRLMKSNLISDMIQGNPVPELICAEEVIIQNNQQRSITWLIDGKQRLTTAKQFMDNQFSIASNVTRYEIPYFSLFRDENGDYIFGEDGIADGKWETYDIRNKKFDDLPEDLQDKFLSFNFNVNLYMNCNSEEIGYHIKRYNQGKAMSKSDKGILSVGEKVARRIKEISGMNFFKENSFKFSEAINGTLNRVCMESVMATYYMNEWKKNPEDIGKFLKDRATEEQLDNLEDTVTRLQDILDGNEGIGEDIFNSKETFIWFSVFEKFKHMNYSDNIFLNFMKSWLSKYSKGTIDGKTYESLEYNDEGKKIGTKDKAVVNNKINFITAALNDFLGTRKDDSKGNDDVAAPSVGNHDTVEETENVTEECKSDDVDEVARNDIPEPSSVSISFNVKDLYRDEDLTEAFNLCKRYVRKDLIVTDVEFFRDMFDEYSKDLDATSPLLIRENRPSMIAITGYAIEKDFDESMFKKWLAHYFDEHSTFGTTQDGNYNFMQLELDQYICFN